MTGRSADAFDILGLEPRFDLSPAAVNRAWLRRSADAHPDRLGASPTDPAESARLAAALNDARRTLEDPERRANALLARLGGPAKEQNKSLPPALLAEVLEIREEMDAARASGAPLTRFEQWADERRAAHMRRVAELFSTLSDPPDPAALVAIRTELNAWRYVERMIEQLDPDYDPARADFA